jgi:hypothetical protein
VSAKGWVELFNTLNNSLDKPLFTPTTIMETENRVYAFVIHTVSLNFCDKVVFTVSTKEISPQKNTSKKLIQLPLGKCNHVRFDIDGIFDWIITKPSGCSIPDAVCTPEQARSELIEPPYPSFDLGIPFINMVLISKIYTNKGKDMSDDELNIYIKDINRYIPGYTKCNIIMGEGCGNSSRKDTDQTVNYTRWLNAMNKIGAQCPGNRSEFDPKCTTGCFTYPKNDVIDSIPIARTAIHGYCLDP